MLKHTLDRDSSEPAYLQLAEIVRTAIRHDVLIAGAKLPSIAEFVATYGVAQATVMRALDVLHHEGLIVGRQGKGVFVRSTPVADPGRTVAEVRHLVDEIRDDTRYTAMTGDEARRAIVERLDALLARR